MFEILRFVRGRMVGFHVSLILSDVSRLSQGEMSSLECKFVVHRCAALESGRPEPRAEDGSPREVPGHLPMGLGPQGGAWLHARLSSLRLAFTPSSFSLGASSP